MKSFLFKLRYVYRNVTRNPFRTISLFLSLTMFSFIVLTALSVRGGLYDGYYLYEDLRHERVDIVVQYDANSTKHIIDGNRLLELRDYIDYYASSFEVPSTIYYSELSSSATIMGCTSEGINPFILTNIGHLQADECIITEKVAETIGVKESESVCVDLAGNDYYYKVIAIVPAISLLEEYAVVVAKESFVNTYMYESLGLNLDTMSGMDVSTNLYIHLKDGVKRQSMISFLRGPDYYEGSTVKDPRNYDDLKANLDIMTGVVYAALAIFVSALTFVIVSILNLRIRNFKNEVGIVETLGEKKTYVFKVLAIEIVILSLFALLFAYLLNTFIYTHEFSIMSTRGHFVYQYKWWQFVGTLAGMYVICGWTILYYYRRYQLLETADLAKNKTYDQVMSLKNLIIVNVILGVIWLLCYFVFPKFMPKVVYSVMGIALTLVFGLMLVSLVLKIICRLIRFSPVFNKTFLYNLKVNRIKHNSLKILLVCLFGIVMCFLVIDTIEQNMREVEDNLAIDTVLVVPSGVTQTMVDQIKTHPNVQAATYGYFDISIHTVDEKHDFLMVFSSDVDSTNAFMGFELTAEQKEAFTDGTKSYIILRASFVESTGMKIGDTIDFSYTNGVRSYEILGVSDIPFQQFAYTNDYYKNGGKAQAIIIANDLNDAKGLNDFRQMVSKEYGKNLCYLYDASLTLKAFIQRARMALKVIYAVVAIIIACFIVSIINNTILNFQEIKTDLATLEVLGISRKSVFRLFGEEMLVSYLAIILPVAFMLVSTFRFFGGFTLVFGYYVDLICDWRMILVGLVVGILCFALSYIYYFVGVSKIDVCKEIKK